MNSSLRTRRPLRPALLGAALSAAWGLTFAATLPAPGAFAQSSPTASPEALEGHDRDGGAVTEGEDDLFTIGSAPRMGIERIAVSDKLFDRPRDLAVSKDGDYLLVADAGNSVIRVVNAETLRAIGTFGKGELRKPRDIVFQTDTRVLVADTKNHRIAVYEFKGVGRQGTPEAGQVLARLVDSWEDGIDKPEGVAVGPDANFVYVANLGDHSVAMLSKDGKLLRKAGEKGRAPLEFRRPRDIDVDRDGRVFVVDSGNDRIQVLTGVLDFIEELEGSIYRFKDPRYLAFRNDGSLFVADEDNNQVKVFDDNYMPVNLIGNGMPGDGPKELHSPEGVVVRGDRIWVSDTKNDRVILFREKTGKKPEPRIPQYID